MIARAHRPSGSVSDLYRREAMKRLGRLDHGTVHVLDGQSLRTGSPIELELAMQSAANVEGYMGLLAAFAFTQSEPEVALRSLIAPELSAQEFAPIYQRARGAQRACGS